MEHIIPLIKGFSTGIGLSLMLGTVFFSIVQNAITHGVRAGIMIAFGVVLSDMIFIYLAIQSVLFADFLHDYSVQVKWIGALFLALFGVVQFFKTRSWKDINGNTPYQRSFKLIATGFFLNVINPVNFFIWLSLSSLLTVGLEYNMAQKTTFFIGSLMSILLTETLIAVFASRLRKYLKNYALQWISRISGGVFIAIAIYIAMG